MEIIDGIGYQAGNSGSGYFRVNNGSYVPERDQNGNLTGRTVFDAGDDTVTVTFPMCGEGPSTAPTQEFGLMEVREDAGTIRVPVITTSGGTDFDYEITTNSRDGSARTDKDFVLPIQKVALEPHGKTGFLEVEIVDSVQVELTEMFQLFFEHDALHHPHHIFECKDIDIAIEDDDTANYEIKIADGEAAFTEFVNHEATITEGNAMKLQLDVHPTSTCTVPFPVITMAAASGDVAAIDLDAITSNGLRVPPCTNSAEKHVPTIATAGDQGTRTVYLDIQPPADERLFLENGREIIRYTVYINDSESSSMQSQDVPKADTTSPQLQSVTVNGGLLTLTYDEPLDNTSTPSSGAFSVTVDEESRPLIGVGTGESSVLLFLGSPVAAGDTVTVDYMVPTDTSANRVQDIAGNAAAPFTGQQVTNNTPASQDSSDDERSTRNAPDTAKAEDVALEEDAATPQDTTPPELTSPVVDGTELILTYDEPLDENTATATSTFAVSSASERRSVNTVTVAGSTITLTLASTVVAGDTVTLDYTVPADDQSGRIQDLAGNAAPSFSGQAVTNSTAALLTASAHGIPASHDGNTTLTFEVKFSEEPKDDFSYKTMRDHAFTVTGGEVVKADRLAPPSNVGWLIHVTPDGDDAVTVVLPATTDCDADGAICTQDGRMLSGTLDLTVPRQNRPATGAPTITGTTQVGETLSADTSAVSDADGMPAERVAYQWIASDGGTDTAISSATSRTYTLVDADEGKSIKVQVSFTDDAGNAESLTSAATITVVAAVEEDDAAPLTASAHDVPGTHDGSTTITFELRFSEHIPLSYTTLRDHAFTVTGGEVEKARRLEQGKNIRWEISVTPNGDGTITVVLPSTTDCEAEGALCTGDRRMLSDGLEINVTGPNG